jgi:hypothetical protein
MITTFGFVSNDHTHSSPRRPTKEITKAIGLNEFRLMANQQPHEICTCCKKARGEQLGTPANLNTAARDKGRGDHRRNRGGKFSAVQVARLFNSGSGEGFVHR